MMNLERFLLLIFLMGLLGIATELVLSEHTETAWQWTPLILIGLAVPALWAQGKALQIVLWLFLVSGVVGTVLHNRAKMEFQAESNPSLAGWELFLKSFDSKNPPALAPGAMVQLGLIGFAYQAARKARRSSLRERGHAT